jgi:hypothetical protein
MSQLSFLGDRLDDQLVQQIFWRVALKILLVNFNFSAARARVYLHKVNNKHQRPDGGTYMHALEVWAEVRAHPHFQL